MGGLSATAAAPAEFVFLRRGCRFHPVERLDGALVGWRAARVRLQDDPHRAVVGQVIPHPVDEHIQPVAEAQQRDQVQAQPGQPRDKAGELDPVEDPGHGAAAPDGRHDAPVNVLERALRLAFEAAQDVARGQHPLLLGDGDQHGVRGAARVFQVGDIAHGVHAGQPLDLQGGQHRHPPPCPQRDAQPVCQRRRADARRPHQRVGRDGRPIGQADVVRPGLDHAAPQDHLDAQRFELAEGRALQARRVRVQQVILHLNQDHPARRIRQAAPVLAAQHVPHQLVQRARRFQAGRAAAHHDHRRERGALVGIVDPGGLLEAAQDVVAQRHRVPQRFEVEGVLADGVLAEVVRLAARGNDQGVVVFLGGPVLGADGHRLPGRVDGLNRSPSGSGNCPRRGKCCAPGRRSHWDRDRTWPPGTAAA